MRLSLVFIKLPNTRLGGKQRVNEKKTHCKKIENVEEEERSAIRAIPFCAILWKNFGRNLLEGKAQKQPKLHLLLGRLGVRTSSPARLYILPSTLVKYILDWTWAITISLLQQAFILACDKSANTSVSEFSICCNYWAYLYL